MNMVAMPQMQKALLSKNLDQHESVRMFAQKPKTLKLNRSLSYRNRCLNFDFKIYASWQKSAEQSREFLHPARSAPRVQQSAHRRLSWRCPPGTRSRSRNANVPRRASSSPPETDLGKRESDARLPSGGNCAAPLPWSKASEAEL